MTTKNNDALCIYVTSPSPKYTVFDWHIWDATHRFDIERVVGADLQLVRIDLQNFVFDARVGAGTRRSHLTEVLPGIIRRPLAIPEAFHVNHVLLHLRLQLIINGRRGQMRLTNLRFIVVTSMLKFSLKCGLRPFLVRDKFHHGGLELRDMITPKQKVTILME